MKRNPVGARRTPTSRALPSLWRQLAADTLDFSIAAVPAAVAYWAMVSASTVAQQVPQGGGPEYLVELVAAAPTTFLFALVIGVAIHAIHHVATAAKWSTTVGGLLFGLRIVDRATGESLPAGRAVLRGVFSGLGVVLFGLGPLFGYWLDSLRRGAGDLFTKAVVLPRDGG